MKVEIPQESFNYFNLGFQKKVRKHCLSSCWVHNYKFWLVSADKIGVRWNQGSLVRDQGLVPASGTMAASWSPWQLSVDGSFDDMVLNLLYNLQPDGLKFPYKDSTVLDLLFHPTFLKVHELSFCLL